MRGASIVLIACSLLLGCRTNPEPSPPAEPNNQSVDQSPTAEHPELRGRVLGHDGQALSAAHVVLRRSGYRSPILDESIARTGHFEATLPGPGAYELTVAGVDHASQELALLVDGADLEVALQLGTYARAQTGERLQLRLRWIDVESQASAPLELTASRSDRDVYALDLEPPDDARALQYQLTSLTEDRSYNGPGGTRWQYDGAGDFWAELDIPSSARLEIDLDDLPAAKLAPKVEVHGASVYPRRQAINLLWPHMQQLKAQLAATSSEAEAQQLREVVRTIALAARHAIEALDDAALADAATLEWAWFFGQFGRVDWIDADDLDWVLARMPADDPTWAFVGTQLHNVFHPYADDPQLVAFRAELAAKQRDVGLRAQLLLLDITEASEHGDLEAIETLRVQLARDYPDTLAAFVAETRYAPSRPLLVGKRMPEWTQPSLDGEGTIGSAQLRGRPYLLDVWSTYCGPCVQEMKYLHDAHAALARAGEDPPIVFVALSIDETRDAVAEFRREQWPMPWINAWVPPAERDALHEAWRFSAIPLTVLVDGEGTIVAVTESLREDALLPTLRAFLAGPPAQH